MMDVFIVVGGDGSTDVLYFSEETVSLNSFLGIHCHDANGGSCRLGKVDKVCQCCFELMRRWRMRGVA